MENIKKFKFDFVISIALIMKVISSHRSKNRAGRGVSPGNMLINKNITKKYIKTKNNLRINYICTKRKNIN